MSRKDIEQRTQRLADAIGELPEQMVCDALDFEGIKRKQRKKRRHYIEVLGGLATAAIVGIVIWHGNDPGFLKRNITDRNKTIESKTIENDVAKGTDQSWGEENLAIWCLDSQSEKQVAESAGNEDNSLDYDTAKKQSDPNAKKETKKDSKDREMDSTVRENSDKATSTEGNDLEDYSGKKPGRQLLEKGKQQLLSVDITGTGKNKKVQFLLQFGNTEEHASYTIKASGVSMELLAGDETAGNKGTLQKNKTAGNNGTSQENKAAGNNGISQENKAAGNNGTLQKNATVEITCLSGTQMACAVPVSEVLAGTTNPTIMVTKETKETEKKLKGEMKLKYSKGKYYLYLNVVE